MCRISPLLYEYMIKLKYQKKIVSCTSFFETSICHSYLVDFVFSSELNRENVAIFLCMTDFKRLITQVFFLITFQYFILYLILGKLILKIDLRK